LIDAIVSSDSNFVFYDLFCYSAVKLTTSGKAAEDCCNNRSALHKLGLGGSLVVLAVALAALAAADVRL
jgi:hypothetical protein